MQSDCRSDTMLNTGVTSISATKGSGGWWYCELCDLTMMFILVISWATTDVYTLVTHTRTRGRCTVYDEHTRPA